jgi:hypothetical protein
VVRLRRRSSSRGKSSKASFRFQGPGRATALRLSSTVSDLRMQGACGAQPMPAWARACTGSASIERPASVMRPAR